MISARVAISRRGDVARTLRADAPLALLAIAHGLVLLAWPSLVVIALGTWWGSNTVAHNVIHRPLFHSSKITRWFTLYLSVLLGIPQTLWKDRHLAHHAGRPPRLRVSRGLVEETCLIAALWGFLLASVPVFFLTAYLPGLALGLGLCYLQGHFEHERGTTSHYGFLYNFLFLNDGYHVEHHRRPGLAWTELPSVMSTEAMPSRWPAVIRFLDWLSLETLEKIAFRSPRLREFLCRTHERAFRALLPSIPPGARVGIVGGGLFPRTALVLARCLPEASLVIIDMSRRNLDCARRYLPENVELVHAKFSRDRFSDFDVLVFPLALSGSKLALYDLPPASTVFVHDWIWRKRGESRVVSPLLLKRLNRVTRCGH